MICRPLVIALLALSGLMTNTSWGQIYTKHKSIARIYPVNSSTSLNITNKYGKVHILAWNKDSVSIVINVLVISEKTENLQDYLRYINVDFTKTSYYISVTTNIANDHTSFITDLKDFLADENEVKIDYTVMVPNYLNVKINNKYGNVYVDNLKGDFNLELSNGDFEADNLLGNCEVNLKFGNARINALNTANLTISYNSEFHINTANLLNIVSKSATVNLDKVNVLKMNSKRDKYFIQDVNFLYGTTYFSLLNVNDLKNETSIDMKYGSLSMEKISNTFSFLNIETKFTDMKLLFEKNSDFQIDILHDNAKLTYPQTMQLQQKQSGDNSHKTLTYGSIGKPNPKSKVHISAEHRNVIIDFK